MRDYLQFAKNKQDMKSFLSHRQRYGVCLTRKVEIYTRAFTFDLLINQNSCMRTGK